MRSVLTIILIVASFALIFSVSNPLWVEVQSLQVKQAQVEDTLTRLTELQGLRDELLISYNSIPRDRLQRLEEMMPGRPEVETLLISLNNVASIHGLPFSGTSFNAAAAAGSGVSPISYSLSLNTSYEGFKDYLRSLEKNLRLVDVKNISFSLSGYEPGNFTLQAASYYKSR